MRRNKDIDPAKTGVRHAHHKADEAEKKEQRVLALKSEILLGPVLAFIVGFVTIAGFLFYIGSGGFMVLVWGILAGVIMAIGAVAIGAV
ncbi:MAG: hypothetical protein AAF213_05810 [Pseudomonadota bacterium]